MAVRIRSYEIGDEESIANLFPEEWCFDFKKFILTHISCNYFRGYTVEYDDEPIGFGNILIFGGTAWIGNIVIKESFRRIGLGSALLGHIIYKGKEDAVRTFNLIATREGEQLYTKFGFMPDHKYLFFKSIYPGECIPVTKKIREATVMDFDNICKLDANITGEQRADFLMQFFLGAKLIYDTGETLRGALFENLGDGFLIAHEPESGLELLDILVARKAKRIIIPEGNIIAKEHLESKGYVNYAVAQRMTKGLVYKWDAEKIYNRGTGYSG